MGRMPSSYGRTIATAVFVLTLTLSAYAHAATSTAAELLLQALLPPSSSASQVTITPDYNQLPQPAVSPSASLTPINAILPGATSDQTTQSPFVKSGELSAVFSPNPALSPAPPTTASSTPLSAAKAALLKTLYAELATLEAELSALEAAEPATSCAPLTISRTLALGSTGADVSALQQFLQTRGYYIYPTITGYFGAVTQKAVEAFQSANGIEAIGSVGPITRAKIAALTNSCIPAAGSTTSATPTITTTSSTATTTTSATIPGDGGGGGGGGGGGSTPTPDTTPPSAPTNLVATATSSSEIDLSWTASTDNVAVANYDVFRNGAQIASPSGTMYQDTGLSAGTPYTYYVEAVETSGNISAASASVSATTTGADITPPSITVTAPTGQLAANTTSTTLSVTTNENATCTWSTLSGQAFASMTTFATTGGTSHSTTLTGLSNGTSYTDYVKCKDTYGNISSDTTVSFSVASSAGTPPTRATYLGMNLAPISYFSSEQPFLNLLKATTPWAGTDTNGARWNDNGFQTPSQSEFNLNANGYPMSMQGENAAAGVTFTEIDTLVDGALPYPYYPAGQYILLYDGQGTFAFVGDATEDVASSTPGRIVLNDGNPTSNGIRVEITSTDPNHTGDYINNMRIVYAPYKSLLDGGELFNPTFINIIKPFSVLRFMDWGFTNNATAYNGTPDPTINNDGNWADRDTPSYVFWGENNGVPIETEVALLNETDADGWFNLPVTATDDYMTQEATLIHNTLGSNQKAYIEFSNEMWNFGFTAIQYAEEQGEALWPNALTTYDPISQSDYSAYGIGLDWYGMRTAQMCDIWKSVWGADANRVVCVMGSMAVNPTVSSYVLTCNLWSGAPCANHGIGALAIAPYFGYSVPDSWTTDPDGGLDKLFTEINSGGVTPAASGAYSGGMIAESVSWVAPQKAIANSYGLQLVGYESGQGLEDFTDATTTPLYIAANRDPRMGSSTATYLQDLQAAGMNFFNYFNDVGGFSKWGSWGSMESIFSTSTPKYNALVNFANTIPPSSLDTTPPSVPANLTANAVSASLIDLSWSASTDNVGVQGYRVFRNGAQIASTNSTSYGDTGLSASTTYSYAVNAYDAAGNQSAQSSTISTTTKSANSYTGPGNLVSGAIFWGGLRAYSTGTAGTKAVRLQRASDSAQMDIDTLLTGQFDTASAASFCASTTCTVVKVYDQSGGNACGGSACDLTVADAAVPTLTFNCNGSQPCITFNAASSQGLKSSGTITSAPQPISMSVVADPTAADGAEFACDSGDYAFLPLGVYVSDSRNPAPSSQIYAGNNAYGSAPALNTWSAGQFVANSTASTISINSGTYTGTGNAGTEDCTGAAVEMSDGDKPYYFTGNVEEFGIWPTAFTGTQQSNMNSNQRSYWNF